eukprot:CAMPEP_0116561188 /NCGR_PEP_ID=MMETSP0397-20121206/11436_1 /TAXON_ID=216820 /ORGANISM="Cyclophora tenuis, Strain ECT3854" /LENGTH=258 /DNA_ID=CAMNT_0004087287 /DNA_START=67 /DNA_END=843 /DNA_ORIENTATION=-
MNQPQSPSPTDDSSRGSYVIEIDGARWEISDFFNESGQSERLYPRLMADDEGNQADQEIKAVQAMELIEKEKKKVQNIDYSKITAEAEPQTQQQAEGSCVKSIKIAEERDLRFSRQLPPPPEMTLSGARSFQESEELLSGKPRPGKQPTTRPSLVRRDSENSCLSTESRERAEDAAGLIIEIFPGMEVKLRGSIETRRAIRKGLVKRVSCMDCSMGLGCIDDAEYVLCPLCKCVSPLAFTVGGIPDGAYGVGLGFQYD